jgi:hypothetical protein
MFTYECGLEARDKITGIQGIIVARIDYLFGCNQYGLSQRSPDTVTAKRLDTEYFDEGRIEIIGRGILPEEVQVEKGGADYNPDQPR